MAVPGRAVGANKNIAKITIGLNRRDAGTKKLTKTFSPCRRREKKLSQNQNNTGTHVAGFGKFHKSIKTEKYFVDFGTRKSDRN